MVRRGCRNRVAALQVVVVVAALSGALAACSSPRDTGGELQQRRDRAVGGCLVSRKVMEVAEDLVREERPAPAEAARFYAYVASTYAEALEGGSQASAVRTAAQIVDVVYPHRAAWTRRALAPVAASVCSGSGQRPAAARAEVLARYVARSKTDGMALSWDGVVPDGVALWSGVGVEPATPRAGDWQRWAVAGPFEVPVPPEYGSPRDKAELSKVAIAVQSRDAAWIAKINFWGGAPGTETPAGVWQKQLYAVLGQDISARRVQGDRAYARAQALLAQVIADAFIECWRVKFRFWTARPSERIPNLPIAMADPPFPAYPSGHAAVSAAAAEVLSALAPQFAPRWRAMARDAADSRLYAGIHFEVDTVEGARLGEAVGREFITKTGLQALPR